MKKFIPLIIALAVLAPTFFVNSCANTTEAPSGGKKDTIPPSLVKVFPMPGATNVPTHDLKIIFTFNEYVTIKEQKNIFLSPPQEKRPKTKMVDKSLIISFEEDLLPNTTYTIDLTGAIADNNEGNMFPGFTLAFSTGDQIDSMYMTGIVQDCQTLAPVKGATVVLYKDHRDSAVFLKRPYAATKTDDWGFFSIGYIKDTIYRIYAIVDESGNNIYDPDADKIAFIDSLVQPKHKLTDTTYELLKFDMKDTVYCLKRKTEHELNIFKEKPTKQFLKNKMRSSEYSAYVTFMAADAWIDSLWVGGYKADQVITQFNRTMDSLEIWINGKKKAPDTLHVFLNYRKTDSLGHFKSSFEHLRLVDEKTPKKRYVSKRNLKHEDTICVFSVKADPMNFELNGFQFEFKYPIISEKFDSLSLISINPKQKEAKLKYEVVRDSTNLRCYSLHPKAKIQTGFEYKLKVPKNAFRDITGFKSDSTEVKVSLPTDDKLSSLTLDVKGVSNKIIVDLLDEKRSGVLRSYVIEKDKKLLFPYLSKGKYVVRITDDGNKNSIVDTGNLLAHKQPEKVVLYKPDGQDIFISIPESTELEQTLDVKELMK